MRKICFRSLFFLLVSLFILILFRGNIHAQFPQKTTKKKIHGIRFNFNKKQIVARGIDGQYALAKSLATLFKAKRFKVLDGGKGFKFNNLYYNKDLVVYKGQTYAKVGTFLKFFNVQYDSPNLWTYNLKSITIPIFDKKQQKTVAGGKLLEGGNEIPFSVIMVGGRKYVVLEDLIKMFKASPDFSKKRKGILRINGKIIDHWMMSGTRIYVWLEDINRALSKKYK
ncbi:MAG: hypothetical protein K8T10_08505 [Candidatus Eremiobacteraeota bacterium]|nr:hypothetical protein [Candidatus Eremiobacteraeota bacterium]